MTPQTAAVVVGAELNGLGVARSLQQGGVQVTILGTRQRNAGLWSRHARPQRVSDFAGRGFVDRLVTLAKTLPPHPVLLLTDEFAVHSVSEHRSFLEPWYCFRLPAQRQLKILADKALFHEFAEANHLPVPRSITVKTAADLNGLAALAYPAIVKPADKRSALAGRAARAEKVVSQKGAAGACLAILQSGGGAIVQEWIEGPDSNIFFTLFYRGRQGAPVMVFTGRKILCFPRNTGSTAACIAAPQQRAELEAMTMAFADCAGFEGMGSMEYKWDSLRGAFFMIEPTVGRTDWQEEIATLCGANIPLAAWQYETGREVEAAMPLRPNLVWRSSSNQRPGRMLMPAGAIIRDGYFRWSDPGPAIAYYVFDRLPKRLLGPWLPERAAHSRAVKQ